MTKMAELQQICVCGHKPHDDMNCPVEDCEPHACDLICPACGHAFSSVEGGVCRRRITCLGHARWGQVCGCETVA